MTEVSTYTCGSRLRRVQCIGEFRNHVFQCDMIRRCRSGRLVLQFSIQLIRSFSDQLRRLCSFRVFRSNMFQLFQPSLILRCCSDRLILFWRCLRLFHCFDRFQSDVHKLRCRAFSGFGQVLLRLTWQQQGE